MPLQAANINDTFFEGVYKDIWRNIVPDGLTEAEADFIIEVANLSNGSKVIDLMCGYGRHAIQLASKGLQVTAVDNLKEYIQEIQMIASNESLPINTILSGVLQVELHGIYDAAICMGNSFAFFNKEDTTAILKKVSKHLKPGGVFIINSWMIAEIAIKYFREREWHQVKDYKYILDYKFLFHPNRIESEQTIIGENGYTEVIKGVDYIFTLDELEAMFNEAGLKTKELYNTPKKKKFNLGDGRIYIVAEKLK